MRIVILGQNRSGTTALFFLLRDSWRAAGGEPELLFEPRAGASLPPAGTDTLAKVLFVPGVFDLAPFADWERRILLTRDPRDVLVSQLLYSLRNTALAREPWRAERFLGRLAEKEQDPAAVPLRALFEELFALDPDVDWDRYLERIRFATEWNARGWHRVRYEDFIDGEHEMLEDHVGFRLLPEAIVDPGVQRVVRTKAAGLWRQWFTPADCAFFDAAIRPYCERFGYDADAEPVKSPHIDPAHATGYVVRALADPA